MDKENLWETEGFTGVCTCQNSPKFTYEQLIVYLLYFNKTLK